MREPPCVPVVRVRYLLSCKTRREIQEEAQLVRLFDWACAPETTEIDVVHRENQVAALKVTVDKAARPVANNLVSVEL